ncbi:peptidase domain-containing ABC transporter [Acidiphilium iwatense]|uniref:Peptidase domain-containing ABC transporter n=1 Tax=Acidiphilium iwatense TaxID=768198 RepID=A0ABS9DV28_9PROT|nr:peptidase domain-containing ABC transporter [Acidiphilium iwatense]MCF3946576.1 peptidase domain-containing ABC transporter [Acidiphilium iwatense]
MKIPDFASFGLDGLTFGFGRHLPIVLQTEAAECGLACLTMVGRYHGHDIDLPNLRRQFPASLKGANLTRLIEIAGRLGLDSRPLRLELEDLKNLGTPCLLHWDLNHFVVLKSADANGVTIHDPSRGVRRLTLAEASRSFTGIALELSPRADFRPAEARRSISLRALAGRIVGLRAAAVQILILALALEIFGILGPFYLQWVIDQVLVTADHSLLTLLGIGFVLVTIFSVAISALRGWVVVYVSTLLDVQWASNVFAHLMRLPLDYFEKRHIGDVVSRYGAVQNIQRTLTTKFVEAVLDGVMAILTLVILFIYSPALSVIVLGVFAAYGALRWLFFMPLRQATEDQIVFAARQQSQLLEAIRGVQPIKLYNKQNERTARYGNALVETANRSVMVRRLHIVFTALQSGLFGLENVALIWLAALLVLRGQFTVGMLIAFTMYAKQFTARAGNLVDSAIELRMLRLYGERLADIVLTPPERHVGSAYEGPLPTPSIELRNVGFRYGDGEPWILRNCSMLIEAGQSAALVGPSGAGKTTLAKLILGLLEPTEGEILVGGLDIRTLGLATYRSMIGAVMQDDQLFAGSIAENISFFDPASTNEQVTEAATMAGIHDEIVAQPMGYRTLVGDMGSTLSGGQRQRLILARALYHRPRILLLDEATSHLDTAREARIVEAIAGLNATRIVIAHRRETIVLCDQIILLNAGQANRITLAPPTPEAQETQAGVRNKRKHEKA